MSEGFIVRRGGGSALPFSVVGGTTQPAGKANLIWVNTSVAITDWTFQSTRPTTKTTGAALSGGEIWFNVGASSLVSFNAIKTNGLWVYPTTCSQYVSGTGWVGRTAKIYQESAWVDWWNGELYDAGNTFSGVTGGWERIASQVYQSRYNTGSLTMGASSMVFAPEESRISATNTANAISMTNYTTLKAIVSNTANDQSMRVLSSKNGTMTVAAEAIIGTYTTSTTIALSVASLTSGYVHFMVNAGRTMTVHKVWLE